MDKYNNSNKKSNWQSEINEKNETSSVEEEGGRRKVKKSGNREKIESNISMRRDHNKLMRCDKKQHAYSQV